MGCYTVSSGETYLYNRWKLVRKEKTRHINFLELKAIQFALSVFKDLSLITLFIFNAITLLLFPTSINFEAVGIAQ